MTTALLAVAIGLAFGISTKLLGLPLPAPNAFAGVLCIAGVYFGALIAGAVK